MGETVVTSPYGDITVVHPDGASEDDIIKYAQQNHQTSVIPDVVKSVMAAPRKAIEGIAGLPGTIGNAMQSGVNAGMDYLTGTKLSDIYPNTPANVGELVSGKYTKSNNPLPSYPDASTIQTQTSKLLGPSYQSQTWQGKVAGGAAEGAFMGVGGAGPKIANMIAGGMSGAGSEAASAALPEDSPWQLPAKIGGGLAGGITSMAGGKALQGVRNYSAGNTVGQQVGQQLGNGPIAPGAISRLASDVEADRLTPQAAQETAAFLGSEGRLFDTSRSLGDTATLGLGTIPGPAKSQIVNTIQGRTGDLLKTGQYDLGAASARRLNTDFDAAMGPSQNMVQLQDGIESKFGPAVKQAYTSVMDKFPDVSVPPDITSRPSVARAMGNAENIAADHGESLRPAMTTQTELAGPGYHIANDVSAPPPQSLKYWDYVKKGMDQKINTMLKGGSDSLSGGEQQTLSGLMDAKKSLVGYLDQATGGQYAQARQLSATQKGLEDASDFGPLMFNNAKYPEYVKQQFDDLSIPEQAMAKASIRRELSNRMGSVGNDATKARQLFNQNNVTDKLSAIFGESAAAHVERAVDRESAFQAATDATKNSLTQPRQQIAASIPGGSGAPEIPSVPTAWGAVTAPLRMGYNAFHNMGSQNTQEGMARMLLSQGDKIPTIVKLLHGYNEKVAGNAAAPLSGQAQAMARALLGMQ